MNTVKIDVKSEEEASRVELIMRFLWAIPSYVVMMILMVIAEICWVLQWILILVTGKRNATLTKFIELAFVYQTQFMAYFCLLTDERSPLVPQM